jgi:uncharacterized membrane protein YvlD (DUF360 family)
MDFVQSSHISGEWSVPMFLIIFLVAVCIYLENFMVKPVLWRLFGHPKLQIIRHELIDKLIL